MCVPRGILRASCVSKAVILVPCPNSILVGKIKRVFPRWSSGPLAHHMLLYWYPTQSKIKCDRVFPRRSSGPLIVGAKVSGRYRASTIGKFGTKWFPATVSALHADGTCDLLYEDGDAEVAVRQEFIKKRQ